MLTCKDVSRQASDYQDKSLSFRERLGFAIHLLLCGRCRAFIAQMKKATQVYHGLAEKRLDYNKAEIIAGRVIKSAEKINSTAESDLKNN